MASLLDASPSRDTDTDVAMDTEAAASPSSHVMLTPARSTRGLVGSAFAPRGHAHQTPSSRTSPLPPPTPMTPNRVRARDERLLRRGQIIAGEFSQRRRKKYEFQVLPDSGNRTASNSSPRETSPARFSTDQVADAVMSFADFLYFLVSRLRLDTEGIVGSGKLRDALRIVEEQEEKQREHPLMPTIIARFSELGAVIESQKRHIDLWKSKELDLAISEAQQNFELIRDLGMQLEQTDVKLSDETVQKQMWEEKYQKAVLEIKSVGHRAQDEIAHLNAKINELQFQKQDLDAAVKTRNQTIAKMEKDFEELRKTAEQMDRLGSTMTVEKRSLLEQREQQERTLHNLQSQVQQLQQQCEVERKRADEVSNAAHAWEIKYQEELRLREHVEGDLNLVRRERDEHASSLKRLLGESGKVRADLEASSVKHEHQVQSLRETLRAKDSEVADLQQRLQSELDRVRKLNQDIKGIRRQAEEGIVAMKAQMEQTFVTQVSRLREELGEETRQVRSENDELQQRCQHLQQLSQKKSNQIAELMTTQQEWVGEGNERLTNLTQAVGDWQAKCEQLQQEIREREKASSEALRKQGADIQGQFNAHVQEMEAYLERKNSENEQLRTTLKSREDDLVKLREEAHAEISKWQKECQELSSRNNSFEFECGALQRELEHRNKTVEMRDQELETLKQQVEAYLAPNNERTKQTELLHRERLRLEEQNHHLQRQIQEMEREFDAKLDEVNSTNHRASEQESAQRATIVSLHHEKDDMQRALSEISGEKVALEGHLQGMLEEKEVLLESLSQFEKQNAELEDKGTQLQHALHKVEKEKTEILHAHESMRGEKAEREARLGQLTHEFAQLQDQHQRSTQSRDARAHVETLTAKLGRRDAEIGELKQQARGYYDSSRSAEEKLARTEQVLRHREEEVKNAKRLEQSAEERAQSFEMKTKQLAKELAQLREWNEQYKRDIQTLNAQADERRGVETNYHQMTSELAQVREWNERYKKEIDGLKTQAEERERQRRSDAEARECELMRQGRGLEAQYEKVKRDLASLQISAEQEVRRLQAALESQKSEFQHEHQRLVATNERLERQARGSGEEYASMTRELERLREDVAQANSDLEFRRSVLQQREDQISTSTREKVEAEERLEECRGQLQRVERAFDDFKRQTMRNVKDKKDAIDLLEEENSGLRSKLAEQTELKEQALQLAQGDKSAMTTDLLRKEQHLSEARARLRHLEEQVKSLQRELKNRDDVTLSATEEEQRKRVVAEQVARELRSQAAKLQDEKEILRAEVSTSTDEIASLKRQLHNFNDEHSYARTELKHTNSEMGSRLHSLELELHQAQSSLVTERDLTKKLKEALRQARDDSQTELEALRSTLKKLTADMERKETAHADQIEGFQSNESKLIKHMKVAQQRCDASASREAELQKELSELVQRTGREREDLLEELKQSQAVSEVLQGDWSLHDGVRELRNRLSDEQKLVRQHASTIERKEAHICELESRLRRLEMRIREQDTYAARNAIDDEVEHELEEMSTKLSKLTMENQRLRDHENREKASLLETSRVMKTELQMKCSRLKEEVKQLRDENENLRTEQQLQEDTHTASLVKLRKRADHNKCEHRIERLIAELEEKELALSSLSKVRESHCARQKDSTPISSSSSSSRRVRELERAVEDKEKKILMLNDHLTYLMTSTIELQHENETMLALQRSQRRRRTEAP